MGWYYDGRGGATRATRASNLAARRLGHDIMKGLRHLEKVKRQREAEQRRQERQSAIKMRELAKEAKLRAKMQELELAAYEVQVYENRIDCLLSVHKECGEAWEWSLIRDSQPPVKPEKLNDNERAAKLKLSQFKPTLCDKLFRRVRVKQSALEKAVTESQKIDILNYQNALSEYSENYKNWQSLVDLSKQIIAGNIEAYTDVIDMERPFDDISELGSLIEFDLLDKFIMGVTVHVNSEKAIPSEIKTLSKTGKLSSKKMPKTKFYEIYQDYVCGCILRIARELFALLPVQTVLITSIGELFDSQTGHTQQEPILSIVISRNILENLNFDTLDPSDSMSNFLCRMKFQKTRGFAPIQIIHLSDLNN